jgi:endogenous inhibitor of DNA gyrase (YacG/DUF329 family)
MSRWTAQSDVDYYAEYNPSPRIVEVTCTTCGDVVEWYPSDGPMARPVTCENCQPTKLQDYRNATHKREMLAAKR